MSGPLRGSLNPSARRTAAVTVTATQAAEPSQPSRSLNEPVLPFPGAEGAAQKNMWGACRSRVLVLLVQRNPCSDSLPSLFLGAARDGLGFVRARDQCRVQTRLVACVARRQMLHCNAPSNGLKKIDEVTSPGARLSDTGQGSESTMYPLAIWGKATQW